jgi:hypothetical protein
MISPGLDIGRYRVQLPGAGRVQGDDYLQPAAAERLHVPCAREAAGDHRMAADVTIAPRVP